ncbi:MAG: serine/threonine protein kinase [Myxococcales bacterium]|nr:serine/threonine protein kinase [Myxococcales bacterium]
MNCPHCAAPNTDDARFCGSCGRATSTTEPTSNPNLAEAPALIGREIAGRYRILAKLGEGGMGAVYKAEQISLKRTVAVKLLRPEVASSQLLLRRFNAEAEAVAKLSHPNTVNIYDFGQDSDGTLFIAMEYIEGQSLRSVIHREAPLSLRRALSIGLQVASSLTDAHARSIIHRDLKPDNVMMQQRGREKDVVRVLDFGIAKLRDENRQSHLAMTQAGDMLGTPQYMAPEQIRAETIDGRTDVYALGCLLYEMITGRLPFEAPTIMSLLSKHLLEAIVPPSSRRPDLALPPAIDQLVLSAMAKDPKVRPATMEDFGEQIAALLATLPGETGQGTAQRPVAGPTGAQSIPTPAAYSALPNAPQMPGPAFAPAQPPPPSMVPHHAGPPPAYAAPAAGAPPYNPHPQPTTGPIARSAPGGGSNLALWIILAMLVLAGGGVGLYLALRKDTKPDPWAEGGSGSGPGSQAVTVAGSNAAGSSESPSGVQDPWNGGAGVPVPTAPLTPDGNDDPPDLPHPVHDSDFTPVMQGVKIKIPEGGFVIKTATSAAFHAQDARGVSIFAFPIEEKSNDFVVLARAYAKETGLMLASAEGKQLGNRGLAVFGGTLQGQQVMHMVTAVIGPGYRVGVAVHIPMVAMQQEPMTASMAMMLLQSGISVPATLKQ